MASLSEDFGERSHQRMVSAYSAQVEAFFGGAVTRRLGPLSTPLGIIWLVSPSGFRWCLQPEWEWLVSLHHGQVGLSLTGPGNDLWNCSFFGRLGFGSSCPSYPAGPFSTLTYLSGAGWPFCLLSLSCVIKFSLLPSWWQQEGWKSIQKCTFGGPSPVLWWQSFYGGTLGVSWSHYKLALLELCGVRQEKPGISPAVILNRTPDNIRGMVGVYVLDHARCGLAHAGPGSALWRSPSWPFCTFHLLP